MYTQTLEVPVSIPYRYSKNTPRKVADWLLASMFQFLIGILKTGF